MMLFTAATPSVCMPGIVVLAVFQAGRDETAKKAGASRRDAGRVGEARSRTACVRRATSAIHSKRTRLCPGKEQAHSAREEEMM